MDSSDIVLSYKDSLLRKSDVELLKPGEWLNDAILSFWFEYLLGEMYPSAQKLVNLVGPEVCQLLKLTPEEEFDGLLSTVENGRFVVFALNNQTDPNSAGGSHWSLFAYDSFTPDSPAIHLDSSIGCNRNSAELFAKRLRRPLVEPKKASQQENTSDCALYVAIFAEILCRYIGETTQDPTEEVHLMPLPEEIFKVKSSDASEKRREITELIEMLSNMQLSSPKSTMV